MFSKGFYILILFISSFVFSTNEATACAKHEQGKECVKSDKSESSQENISCSKSCCQHNSEDNEDKPLTPCGNCKCNCVQSISYIPSEFTLDLKIITITSYFSYGWDYNQPLPEKPLYSIWQPPQLV